MTEVSKPVDQPAGEPSTTGHQRPSGHRTLRATLVAVGIVAIAALVPALGSRGSAATAGQLRTALIAYYRLLPGDTTSAWHDLTPGYQRYVGGLTGYQSFWRQVDKVVLINLSASAPGSVTVTIDYYQRAGDIEVEQTDFTLVQQNGQWKIASSSVASHHTEAG